MEDNCKVQHIQIIRRRRKRSHKKRNVTVSHASETTKCIVDNLKYIFEIMTKDEVLNILKYINLLLEPKSDKSIFQILSNMFVMYWFYKYALPYYEYPVCKSMILIYEIFRLYKNTLGKK